MSVRIFLFLCIFSLRMLLSYCKGVCDGAGAVIIASESALKKHSLTPLARVVAYHSAGCDPSIMGIGKLSKAHHFMASNTLKCSCHGHSKGKECAQAGGSEGVCVSCCPSCCVSPSLLCRGTDLLLSLAGRVCAVSDPQ